MPSEDEYAEALREAKWALGLICVECGSREVKRRSTRDYTHRYYCKNCGRWFNNKTGTPMAHSKLPLRVWFYAAFTIRSRVSFREISRTLGMHAASKKGLPPG